MGVPYGATVGEYGTLFRVWAPDAKTAEIVLASGARWPATRGEDGTFTATLTDCGHGARYRVSLDGGPPMPDPTSRFQPEGVHGPSEVVDPASFTWRTREWRGLSLDELVIYELHVGTFTAKGTFDGVREKLGYLRELGVTAIELMPVADFQGRWNWGYDPAAFFAPSRAYGRPEALKALVDAAHAVGLGVILDVVYNHFGPDGAYAPAFSKAFFTEKHKTPWGPAINLDGPGSRHVREWFLQNAMQWLGEYRFDGLRLDATFALQDDSPTHFLAELAERAAALDGPKRILIAEDHRNLRTLVLPRSEGGYGLDAAWADDFHHQVRRLIAGDHEGYYRDYAPNDAELVKAVAEGWIFQGQRSEHLGHARGTPAAGLAPSRFVFCIQNHDQVGNRPIGDRLEATASESAIRAATALLLFAPQTPMLFMGQEWAASAPFLYFTDHEPELGKLVTKGRTDEFRDFAGFAGAVPDPQDPSTFEKSRLDWSEAAEGRHARRLEVVRELLRIRRTLPPGPAKVTSDAPGSVTVRRGAKTMVVALRDGVTVAVPSGASVAWHTGGVEADRDALHFPHAGAALLE